MDINEFKKLSVQYEALIGIISKINETKDPIFDDKLKLLIDLEKWIFEKILLEIKDCKKNNEDEDDEFLNSLSSDWDHLADLAAADAFPDRSTSKDASTLLEYSTSPDKRYEKSVLDISDQMEKIRKTFKLVDSSCNTKVSIDDDQLKNKTNDSPGS